MPNAYSETGSISTTCWFAMRPSSTNADVEIDGKPWLLVVDGVYHDRMVHTDKGWRICHRVEETVWWDNPLP